MFSFQKRAYKWLLAAFGGEHNAHSSADHPLSYVDGIAERIHRHWEESLELGQSLGGTAEEAHQLVDYVFSRPAGEPYQEVGGTIVTLALLCEVAHINMELAAEEELDRVWDKIEIIRAKRNSKPDLGPLPGFTIEGDYI
jgi:hypothetical protein